MAEHKEDGLQEGKKVEEEQLVSDSTVEVEPAQGHSHDHPNHKKVVNRLARITGHTNAIKRMVEEGRDCSEVLIQIAAVKSALTNVGKLILDDHINHCIVRAVQEDDQQSLEDLTDAIDKFVK